MLSLDKQSVTAIFAGTHGSLAERAARWAEQSDGPLAVEVVQSLEGARVVLERSQKDAIICSSEIVGNRRDRWLHLADHRPLLIVDDAEETTAERLAARIRKALRAAATRASHALRVIDSLGEGILVLDRRGRVLFANPQAAHLLGRPHDRLVGELPGLPPAVGRAPVAFRNNTRNTLRTLELKARDIAWDGDTAVLATLTDISQRADVERREREATRQLRDRNARLSQMLESDHLTGCLNRAGIEHAFDHEQRQASTTDDPQHAPLCAVLIDCDDFKSINDEYGHKVGDTVLRQIARRMNRELRPSDYLGRIGGDEFFVLLPETQPDEAHAVANRLRDAVCSHPIREDSALINATVSLAILEVPKGCEKLDDLLPQADSGLREGKRSGKNRAVRC